MTRAKLCAECRHPKSHHRTASCRHTWQAMGATFMGNRIGSWHGVKPQVEIVTCDFPAAPVVALLHPLNHSLRITPEEEST